MAKHLVHPHGPISLSHASRPAAASAGFLAAMFALAIVSVVVFAWLANEMLESEFLKFNSAVLRHFRDLSSPAWTTLAKALSAIGSDPAIGLISLVFGVYLVRRRLLADAATFSAVMGGGALLTMTLKKTFHEARPQIVPHLVPESTFSFPSGHATMSWCLCGFLAIWLIAGAPRSPWRYLAALAALALSFCIGMSRLYLGVHWPTDVAAGFVLATFWVSVCWLARARWVTAKAGAARPAEAIDPGPFERP